MPELRDMMGLLETPISKSHSDEQSAQPGLPVLPPINAFVELFVFFLVVMGLEWGVQGFPYLNEVQPHPFWLPVLLLSLQYGTVSGLMAAGVSIAVTAFMGWPEQDIGENHFNYLIRIWSQPVLWIAAALLIGQFRMRQIAERLSMHRSVDELRAQRQAITVYAGDLRDRCETLERRIAGQHTPSAHGVIDALVALGRRDPAAVQQSFGLCVENAFGPGQYSLSVLQNEELRLAAAIGWEPRSPWVSAFLKNEPLFQALVLERRCLIILREADVPALQGQGVAAVPVLSPAGDVVRGILKVEAMAPEQFNSSTLSRMELLATHLAASLELYGDEGSVTPYGHAVKPVRKRKQSWRQARWHPSRPANKPEDVGMPKLKKPKIVR